jgi:hypothetical protein
MALNGWFSLLQTCTYFQFLVPYCVGQKSLIAMRFCSVGDVRITTFLKFVLFFFSVPTKKEHNCLQTGCTVVLR